MFFISFFVFASLSFVWCIVCHKRLGVMANDYVKKNYAEQWQEYESKAQLMKVKPNSMVIHSIKQGELSAVDDDVLKSFKKKHHYIVTQLCLSPLLSSYLSEFIVYLSK